jgi:serine/threonine-protein kinase RsbW
MHGIANIRLLLPSQLPVAALGHTIAETLAGLAGLGEEEALNFALAVHEALVNGMKHGNRLDPSKTVELEFQMKGEKLMARIRDQGDGFDPGSAPDPTAEENLLRTSGRGLLMIRSYVDEVSFRFIDGEGMEITLTKSISQG